MRNNNRISFFLALILLVFSGTESFAQPAPRATIIPASKRPFNIFPEGRDLAVENAQLRLLREETVPVVKMERDLTLSPFIGQSYYSNQRVRMGDSIVQYEFDVVYTFGLNFKKNLNGRRFGFGGQIEYQTFENDDASIYIIPATGFVFARSLEWSPLRLRALGELGYSWAYIRQVGTVGRTGGLGAHAAFWQAGIEFPFYVDDDEEWAMGVFYSERRLAKGDFNLSGETVKIQGSLSL